MKTKSLTAAGVALMLTLAGFGLAGPASAAPDKGANAAGPYTSCETLLLDTAMYPPGEYECDPARSMNGQGKAPHLAGSKGKADDKNPPGQVKKYATTPAGSPDNGYECDGNSGIAKGNPAHTGCVVPVEVEDDGDDAVIIPT